jgi:hypothetical protein
MVIQVMSGCVRLDQFMSGWFWLGLVRSDYGCYYTLGHVSTD